ncbi:hypothetical protein AVCANL279_00330 [Campylobacter canadensis]|uniref:COG3014 family protein n=1 Tax=Campylobacter canadensis TaxID=449520 RepID=UPI001556DCF6|nr:hypothetical protein [Campylobacter canadensis]MBZ7994236.1 hypothetical protein [Campylobacter canadensis]MBZ7995772.1 hypothetical protein [Campylobacter canadensis]MBZ7999568.1 hypothetical protein [Campylobacter canadensis]MBZ8001345.1 hypothetical protein [Campylobacter canadensis]MBZ8004258.1 hypothetical protein [Campylobacter canadensis]
MKMKSKILTFIIFALFFSSCANYVNVNANYEKALIEKKCDEQFFSDNLKKIKQNDDVIYTGLNVGLIARNCGDFNLSNVFFDAAENAYKYDVDLKSTGKKAINLIGSTFFDDNILDYDGSLYERIMLNTYKALNFMSLNDYENARVEFNRALMRQDKAKEYFAKEIEKNRADLDKAKEDKNYDKNMLENKKDIEEKYNSLFKEFNTTKEFINPYATYLASIFFFMDKDYRKAADLFKEVSVIYPKNLSIKKQAKIFNEYANKFKIKNEKKYIFVLYENGFSLSIDEFKLPIPFTIDGKIIFSSIALQTLKKNASSYPYLLVNNVKTDEFVNLDDIIATEFKINSPQMITKALARAIVKTTINIAVAKNDSDSGLLSFATALINDANNNADVRSWRGLAKSVSVAVLDNKGFITVNDENNNLLFEQEINKNKNVILILRSFAPYLPLNTSIIER